MRSFLLWLLGWCLLVGESLRQVFTNFHYLRNPASGFGPVLYHHQIYGPNSRRLANGSVYEQWLHCLLFERRKHLSWGACGFYFLIQLLDDFESGTLTKKIILLGIYIYLNWVKKLIAWKRVFGEKLICRRIPFLLWKPKVDYGDSRSWPHIPVVIQPNLLHTLSLVQYSPVTLVCTNIPIYS